MIISMSAGHGGVTYGFLSEQGWIPQLNAVRAEASPDAQGLLKMLMRRAIAIMTLPQP